MKKIITSFLICSSSATFALEAHNTGVSLSSNLGELFCQNYEYNSYNDWRMPSLVELMELVNDGMEIENEYCSSTINESIQYHQCLNNMGILSNRNPSQSFEILCVRGTANFSENPDEDNTTETTQDETNMINVASGNCPTVAGFSSTTGILNIPIVEVPNFLGDIQKYAVKFERMDNSQFKLIEAIQLEE